MALIDRPGVRRLLETAEQRLNVTVQPYREVQRLRMVEAEFGEFAQDAEELALHSLDYFGGRPQDLRRETRIRLAQRSRIALLQDPLAGAEAELLASFGFGKGVPIPTARDPKVQDVIDSAWCHDVETEALTEDGWLGYAELRERWEAGTLPRLAAWRDGEIVFERPLAMAATAYEGPMVRVESRMAPSFMVTPNHRMLTRRTALGTGGWTIRRAHEMRCQEYVPTAGVHEGVRADEFVLPGCFRRDAEVKQHPTAGPVQTVAVMRHEALRIPMAAWLRWVGLFISEGAIEKPSVCQQTGSPRLSDCVRVCAELGVEGRTWTRAGRMWEWQPKPAKQFRTWLREHVGVVDYEKRIPEFVFSLAAEHKHALLDGLMLGDGSPADWRDRGKGYYATCSRRLADDVQRLATLVGWRATVSEVDRTVTRPGSRVQYVVYLHRRSTRIVTSKVRRVVEYAGVVWCFRMPSGTMVTRRDGTVLVSGNTDPINEQTLTGYQAQRKLSNELLTCAELFVTLYIGGGKIRVGRLDPDLVTAIVTDPENRNIPLWYVARERKYKWNFATDQPDYTDTINAVGQRQVKYWPHWRNVDDAISDRNRFGVEDDEDPLEEPPAEKLAKGKVYHLAINQTGEQLRGNPPWARSLRFFSAMNVLTEAHVTMAQAASTFIARRAMKGSPRQITKAAESVVRAAGELGAAAFRPASGWGIAGNAEPTTEPFVAPSQPGPFPPGSWWNDNDSSTLSPLNLQSGAGQMAQTAQIVRAPIAASSQFGQHYLGDPTSANLATASTLELPATMRVGAWQEFFEQLYRWFTDRAIEAAVQAGLLGGAIRNEGDIPLTEMRLHEAENRAEMESRTGKDLSYEFSMPFPGRRQLGDVTTAVQVISGSQDPNGVNVPLRRILLKFFFEQIGIDDVARAVDECIPEKGMPGGIGAQQDGGGTPGFAAAAQKALGQGQQQGDTPPGSGDPAEGGQPYGARAQGSGQDGGEDASATEAEWLDGSRQDVSKLQGATAALFRELVADPKVLAGVSGE